MGKKHTNYKGFVLFVGVKQNLKKKDPHPPKHILHILNTAA
jgi:hypothetical protein